MIVHLNGAHPRHNTPDISPLSLTWTGYVFDKDSPLYVGLVHQISGIVPDRAIRSRLGSAPEDKPAFPPPLLAGWFTDTMPQTLVTNVVQYRLDVVVFSGNEKPLLLDNLRRTIVPDLSRDIQFVKRIVVRDEADLLRASDYQEVADYILFDFVDAEGRIGWQHMDATILSAYKGTLPFLVGALYEERVTVLDTLPCHTHFAGVTLHC